MTVPALRQKRAAAKSVMRSVLITGGAKGIGAETARQLAEAGYRVGLVDCDAASAAALAARLPNASAYPCDVRDEAAIEAVLDAFGTPYGLVNNAGIVHFAALLDTPQDAFRRVIETDLVGAFLVARAAARRMITAGGGVLVNVTSTVGICTSPGTNAYAAAKAGLAALSDLMALEWGPRGVRVNAVAPGMVDGGISAPIFADPAVKERRGRAVPLGRIARLEEIAAVIRWLISDEASYVHGHHLVVDGGMTKAVMTFIPR